MSVQFTCPNCQAELNYAVKNVGQEYTCYSCGFSSSIPGATDEHSLPVNIVPSAISNHFPFEQAQVPQARIPVINIAAIVCNIVWIGLMLIGMIMKANEGTERSGIFVVILYGALVIANILCLAEREPGKHPVVFTIDIIVLLVISALLIIFSSRPAVKIGGLVQLAVGIVTSLAFLSGPKDSWLSLYFERRRLEEKRKIAALEQDPCSRAQ